MPPTLDAALLCSSKAGFDLGLESGLAEKLCQLGFLNYNGTYHANLHSKVWIIPKWDSNLGLNAFHSALDSCYVVS